MSLAENRPSISDASARVDLAETLQAQSNTRLVAILTVLEMTKVHGGHHTWTDGHAQALRTMISICDKLAEGPEYRPNIKSI